MNLAMLSATLSAVFAVAVLMRWRRSRRAAFAAWATGLAIFAAAAVAQAIGQASGFTEPTFRVFYLLGGVLGVAYLALGTVHLLAPASVARICTVVLVVATMGLAVDALLEPVDAGALTTAAGVMGGALVHQWSPLRVGAVVLNIVGSLVLIGGSAWSAWRLLRTRSGVDRVACNVLLTVGALIIAAGFSAAKAAGGGLDALGAAEAAGIAIMFAGFLSLGRLGKPSQRRSTLPAARPVER